MSTIKTKKRLLIAALFLLLVLSLLVVIIRYTPKPPAAEINQAMAAITDAKKARADVFSPSLLSEAMSMYDSAMVSWRLENEKWILTRDYSQAKAYASDARHLARRARLTAFEDKSNLRSLLKNEIDSIKQSMIQYRTWWKTLPIDKDLKNQYEHGKLLFTEAQLAFKNSDYLTSQDKLLQAGEKMRKATAVLDQQLEDYFSKQPVWLEMIKATIRESRSGKAIIVDKFDSKCFLYKHGKLIQTYDMELGINWIGDKRHQGDKATPEGRYKVVKKKKGGDTIYYKALLLNYPNEQDRARFEMEKKRGSLAPEVKIGGLIEIHGGGGRGVHWTDGCIAVTDDEMNFLYDFAEVNTPVTIVGSAMSLDKLRESLKHE